MANTLGNPTIDTTFREAMVSTANEQLKTGSSQSAQLILRRDTTVLVTGDLDDTNPLTLGASDGACTLNFKNATDTASGGSASVPNNYQIKDQAGTVRMTGIVSATSAITAGDLISWGTATLTMPAVAT